MSKTLSVLLLLWMNLHRIEFSALKHPLVLLTDVKTEQTQQKLETDTVCLRVKVVSLEHTAA